MRLGWWKWEDDGWKKEIFRREHGQDELKKE